MKTHPGSREEPESRTNDGRDVEERRRHRRQKEGVPRLEPAHEERRQRGAGDEREHHPGQPHGQFPRRLEAETKRRGNRLIESPPGEHEVHEFRSENDPGGRDQEAHRKQNPEDPPEEPVGSLPAVALIDRRKGRDECLRESSLRQHLPERVRKGVRPVEGIEQPGGKQKRERLFPHQAGNSGKDDPEARGTGAASQMAFVPRARCLRVALHSKRSPEGFVGSGSPSPGKDRVANPAPRRRIDPEHTVQINLLPAPPPTPGRSRWSSIPRALTVPEDIRPSVVKPRRLRALVVATGCLLLLSVTSATGQEHRLRLFAGAGLQFFAHPELSLGRGAGLGGTAELRTVGNFSIATGFFFGRSNRRYTAGDDPVEDVVAEPAYQFRTNRYHLDGSIVYHLGRRQPFQMYFAAGGGIVRRDELREDFIYDTTEPVEGEEPTSFGIRIPIGNEVTLEQTAYSLTAHAAIGLEVYVFSYLSARAEYRIWSSKDFSFRTQQAMIGVNYYR